MVLRPSSSTRCSANQRTACVSVRLSSSCPIATSSFAFRRVVDADHVLLDDRALVEVGRDEVRRRADQLHAAGVRLLVGVRALEAGQERVVDVDRAAREPLAQRRRQDLHVAREHDELDVVLLDRARRRAPRTRPSSRGSRRRGARTAPRRTRRAPRAPRGCRAPAGSRRAAGPSAAGTAGRSGSARRSTRARACERGGRPGRGATRRRSARRPGSRCAANCCAVEGDSTCIRRKNRPVSSLENCWLSVMLPVGGDDRSGHRVHDAGAVRAHERQDPVGVGGVRHGFTIASATPRRSADGRPVNPGTRASRSGFSLMVKRFSAGRKAP